MKNFLFAILLVGLSACQSLGLAPADTLDSKIAYAYGIHTAVLQSAGDLTTTGVLTKADDFALLKSADSAKEFLDSAVLLENIDATSAGNKLVLATAILTELQTYLRSKGAK